MAYYSKAQKQIQYRLNKLPDSIESIVLPILSFSNKLILTGTSSLYVLGVFQRHPSGYHESKIIGDVDFTLREPLTLEEYLHIKDFFGLKALGEKECEYSQGFEPIMGDPVEPPVFDPNEEIKRRIIQLKKYDTEGNEIYKVDIFNKEYINEGDILLLPLPHVAYNIQIQHPSITWSHKTKLALDPRVSTEHNYKHSNDLKLLLNNINGNNSTEYYHRVRYFEEMSNRIKKHGFNLDLEDLPF
jgi:hypothetical protein